MQMQKKAAEKHDADSRSARLWTLLRWLLFLPCSFVAFGIAAVLGALIARAIEPSSHGLEPYAFMFCATYAAILAGAFIAPKRLVVGRILSCLYLLWGIIMASVDTGPGTSNAVRWLTVLVVALAVSAAYAMVWLWERNPKNVTKRTL